MQNKTYFLGTFQNFFNNARYEKTQTTYETLVNRNYCDT